MAAPRTESGTDSLQGVRQNASVHRFLILTLMPPQMPDPAGRAVLVLVFSKRYSWCEKKLPGLSFRVFRTQNDTPGSLFSKVRRSFRLYFPDPDRRMVALVELEYRAQTGREVNRTYAH